MNNFKIQQAVLKHINKGGDIGYSPATSQQLEIVNEDGEIFIKQGDYGYWLVFEKNAYRIDEKDLYINLEKIKILENGEKINNIERMFNIEGFMISLIKLDEPKICIKSEESTYAMFLYGKDKYFVQEKDLKVLENNYKDYEYKLCKIEEEVYILAISIRREIVAIFMDNRVEEVDLIGGKYENDENIRLCF